MVQNVRQQQAGKRRSARGSHGTGRLCLVAVAMAVLSASPHATAASPAAGSPAAKNREGNRLFAQGKYEDAEKAYVEAQVKSPGKSEVLYNLGNALIKQKKYDQGLQSLRQSMDKGDKDLREKGWYNSGNALFSKGSFKDAADAYVQALKLNPSDLDAKHNLELALLKLKQQQETQSGSDQKKQNSGNSDRNQSSSGKQGERQQAQSQKDQSPSGSAKEQKTTPDTQQSPRENPRPGSISREQAAQILDAVQNQELEQQRKLLEALAQRKANGKDW